MYASIWQAFRQRKDRAGHTGENRNAHGQQAFAADGGGYADGFRSALAFAGDVKKPSGVVELFTSQGCSSCPPADAVLAELAEAGDVVALGYHVDYWDYLGWKDTLGSPENTARQYEYGKSFGDRSVYTPQAVINGRTHVNGAKREAVARRARRA